MDRVIIYPGQIPLETDLLNTNKNMLVALGRLIGAIYGTSTLANGLAATPTAPASLSITIGTGELYALEEVDQNTYSTLGSDTSHSVMKQGIVTDPVTLTFAAPSTSGTSVNYLVQAQYEDTDGAAVALPYYNASNPQQAFLGPNNNGVQQPTKRQGTVAISVVAGVAAATGSQTTPAPQTGNVGLYVVSVANGQTQIVSGNITVAPGAPFITERMGDKVSLADLSGMFDAAGAAAAEATARAAAITSLTNTMNGLFSGTFSASGSFTVGSGANTMIVQWGPLPSHSQDDGAYTVTFAETFPSACYGVVPSTQIASVNTSTDDIIQVVGNPSTSSAQFMVQTMGAATTSTDVTGYYFAWGK